MKRMSWVFVAVVLGLVASGCGKTESGPASATSAGAQTSTETAAADGKTGGASPRPADGEPDAAVWDFLEAVRTGSDDKAAKMLTPLARSKVSETNMVLAPPGTDTARFVIGATERLAEDGARVTVEWTDLDYNGKPRTDQTIWMVRKEADGWRIAGMAVPVFENEPMVLMNFEDPADMLAKQKMVHDEIQRRAKEQEDRSAATGGGLPSVDGPAMTADAGAARDNQAAAVPGPNAAPAASADTAAVPQQVATPGNALQR